MTKRISIPLMAAVIFAVSYWYWSLKPALPGTCFANVGSGYARQVECPALPPVDPQSWMLFAMCICIGATGAAVLQWVMDAMKIQRCPYVGCAHPTPDLPIQGRMPNGDWGVCQERCKKCDGLIMWSSTKEQFVRWNDDTPKKT